MADQSATGDRQNLSRVVDVVALLRSDTMAQVIPLARPIQATVFDVSQTMEHPLETGSVITDHLVNLPIEIQMPVIIPGDFKETFAALRQLKRQGVLLTVLTKVGAYASMVLQEIPHDETPESLDAIVVNIRLRQADFITAVYGGLAPAQVKSKPQASTAKRGAQQTTITGAAKTTAASDQYRGSTLYRITR